MGVSARGRSIGAALALTLATLLSAAPASGAPGDLDPSFSKDGRTTFSLGGDYSLVGDLAIDSAGRLVAAGVTGRVGACDEYLCDGQSRRLLTRFTADGRLDPTFGSGGLVHAGEMKRGLSWESFPVGSQPSGATIVPPWGGGLVGARPNDSIAWTANSQVSTINDILVLPSGAFLVGGANASDDLAAIGAHRPSGAPDPGFAGGLVELPQEESEVWDLLRRPTGEILAVGETLIPVNGGQIDVPAVWQFEADGSPDESFSTDGFSTYRPAGTRGAFPHFHRAALTEGGDLLIASPTGGSTGHASVVQRIRPDGTRDPAFGTNGFRRVEGVRYPSLLVPRPDGGILVAYGPTVVMLSAEGELDRSFGGGDAQVNIPRIWADVAVALPDGRLAIGGSEPRASLDSEAEVAVLTFKDGPPNADADPFLDPKDDCPGVYAKRKRGCPWVSRGLELRSRGRRLSGRFTVASPPDGACLRGPARLIRRHHGKRWIFRTRAGRNGHLAFGVPARPGKYVAKARAFTASELGRCARTRSEQLRIGSG